MQFSTQVGGRLEFPLTLYQGLLQAGVHNFALTCLFQPHSKDRYNTRVGFDKDISEVSLNEVTQFFLEQREFFGVNEVDDSRLSILLNVTSGTVYWTHMILSVDVPEKPVLTLSEPSLMLDKQLVNVSELLSLDMPDIEARQALRQIHTLFEGVSDNPLRDVVYIDKGQVSFFKYCEHYSLVSEGEISLAINPHFLLETLSQT